MKKAEIVSKLTPADRKLLAKHEETIKVGLDSFVEVGNALGEIWHSRLFRDDYKSFDAYCKERWDLPRQRAYEKIAAAELMTELKSVRNSGHFPLAESHAVELSKAKKDATKVWAEVVRLSPKLADGSPSTTAKKIAAIRDELLKPKPANKPITPPQPPPNPAEPPPAEDETPFEEPAAAREPGEDDGDEELDNELGKIEDWDGAKINRLLKALHYYENRIVKAEAIIDLRISRLFPHHGLPLKRWSDELSAKTRELVRFRQKLEAAKRQQKGATA